jgi:hypothetical protein
VSAHCSAAAAAFSRWGSLSNESWCPAPRRSVKAPTTEGALKACMGFQPPRPLSRAVLVAGGTHDSDRENPPKPCSGIRNATLRAQLSSWGSASPRVVHAHPDHFRLLVELSKFSRITRQRIWAAKLAAATISSLLSNRDEPSASSGEREVRSSSQWCPNAVAQRILSSIV